MHKFRLRLFVGLLVTCGLTRPATAIKPFQVEFEKLYIAEEPVGEESETELDKLFKEKKLKKFRCLVCHQGKKKKKNRNAYGDQLSEFLDKKKDKKDKEKIVEALMKVAEIRSDPEDEKSPTFGELIAGGKLPGGTLEELMEEPESSEKVGKGSGSSTQEKGSSTKKRGSSTR